MLRSASASSKSGGLSRRAAEVAKILAMPDFRGKVGAQGLEVFVSTPEQYGTLLRNESEKFARIVKSAGIQPE